MSAAPGHLWLQANAEHPDDDAARRARYRKLMIEHGHLIPGKPEPLPCGWSPSQTSTAVDAPPEERRAEVSVAEDSFPPRPRARRDIGGKSPSGIEVRGYAFADPIPGSLDYGPFRGEGEFALSRSGSYVVGNIRFEEIPEVIALLQEALDAASAPAATR